MQAHTHKRPRLLDLYCGGGGAAMGYHKAGFDDITGVDIEPQPRYPFAFVQADALEYLAAHWQEYDAFHASPPCGWITYAAIQWRKANRCYPALLSPTRDALLATERPYVIEQPVGAVLRSPIRLNGATFGLRVKRDRYFETNWPLDMLLLNGEERPVKMSRPFDARKGGLFYPVGHFSGVAEARAAMGIDWPMTQKEIAQAIPPAYAEYIGKQLMAALYD